MWHRIIDFANLEKKYGEGTKFDLDYGKLLIIFHPNFYKVQKLKQL